MRTPGTFSCITTVVGESFLLAEELRTTPSGLVGNVEPTAVELDFSSEATGEGGGKARAGGPCHLYVGFGGRYVLLRLQ